MIAPLVFGFIWLILIIYALFFAPPNQPETLNLIFDLSTGNWQNINPTIIALFNLMGILPLIYACFLLVDGQEQKFPAWIFVISSFGLGIFALLPYFALRKQNSSWSGKNSLLIQLLESPLTAILLTISTLTLIFFAIFQGNWFDFVQQWQTNKFINVMSLDFCLLCLFLPAILKDDLRKRKIENPVILTVISLIPLLGTLIYLCFRPKLPEN